MEVNTIEHRPRTVIIADNDSVGIMIDITDDEVSISIEDAGSQITFVIDHDDASDISHKIYDAIDSWSWKGC